MTDNMFMLDDKFLDDLGLGTLPKDQKVAFLQHISSELEIRIGEKLTGGMSDAELDEFGYFIDGTIDKMKEWLANNLPNYANSFIFKQMRAAAPDADEATLLSQYGAITWLQLNRSDYPGIVAATLEELKKEIKENKDIILGQEDVEDEVKTNINNTLRRVDINSMDTTTKQVESALQIPDGFDFKDFNKARALSNKFDDNDAPEIGTMIIQKCAESGNLRGALTYAHKLRDGTGVDKNPKEAFKLYQKVAETLDDPRYVVFRHWAEYNVAYAYEIGSGVTEDPRKAFEWHERAAKHGNLPSMQWMGDYYYLSLNESDAKKAFDWYLEATKVKDDGNGHRHGAGLEEEQSKVFYKLGMMYKKGGNEVPENHKKYIEWVSKSAKYGYPDAILELKLLEETDQKTSEQDGYEKKEICIKNRTTVFVSYSHKDAKYEEELRDHLEGMAYSDIVDYWDDSQLKPGDQIDETIKDEMAKAKFIIMLVSPAYFASWYVRKKEFNTLIEAAEKDGAIIIWIPVSPVSTKGTALENIRAIFDKDKALDDKRAFSEVARNRVYKEIAEQIYDALNL